MKKISKILIITPAAVAIVLIAVFILQPFFAGNFFRSMPLRIALPRHESALVLWVAKDICFFKENGLNVTFTEPDTGAAALEELQNKKADMAGTSELPFVSKILAKEDVRVLTYFGKADYMFIIARKDRRIEKIADLRGKKIGIITGTIHVFYLSRLLGLNGMKMEDIKIINTKTSMEIVTAIIEGKADAVVTAEPFFSKAKNTLGAKAVYWPAQSSQNLFGLLVSSGKWIKEHPRQVVGLIKSLAQAEDYIMNNPAGAKAIFQERLKVDNEFTLAAWKRNQFSIGLDQSLIAAMEDEARWMIKNKLTSAGSVPDFYKFIYTDALKSVKPGSVNILGY
ncbi:MAG: NrtA/SsuA/CpmA family ABC transporter substrate-binding protein [Spirochaetota bacterium]